MGRPDPGARRRRAVGEPVAPAPAGRRRARIRRGALPGRPRDDPVRQGQLAPQRRRGARHLPRAARLRPLPRRRPRDRLVGRHRARRVHRGRDARRLRRGGVARGPAVVRWRHRDVGDQLRRVHLDPGREAPAAAPARDRPGHGHRRPLPQRRPLHRRLRDRERAQPVRGQPGRDERDATGSRVSRRRVARGVAGPPRGDPAVAHRVAAPAARRSLLACRFAGARLRRDRGGDPQRRWLDGLVRRRGPPDAGCLFRSVADDRRQLDPQPPGRGHTGSEPRRPPRARALLRPLAEGDPERRRRGAGDHLVRARIRRARTLPGGVARALAGGERLPAPGDGGHRVAVPGRIAATGRRAGGGRGRRATR